MQKELHAPVPHLTTALTGPLLELEQHLLAHQVAIEAWLRQQWVRTPAPLYSSVDLRNAGFKLAPVDTNLFPAGFNNLNPDFMPLCVQALQATLAQHFPTCQRLLLIPENHTRNLFYFESLANLVQIFSKAGFDVKVGSLAPDLTVAQTMVLPSGQPLTLEPITRTGHRLQVGDFQACLIILNNDLSSGIPELLQGITQPVWPATALGWHRRLKSRHFTHYQAVCQEFANKIKIDPWLIDPLFDYCDGLDFLKRTGEAALAAKVDNMLQAIQARYDHYQIKQKPYVVVKADAGTYGMGVMTVQSAEELLQLNRKTRTKMATTKDNQTVSRVLIQEGVYSFETLSNGAVAEPVVYMIGQYVVGGFYRVHTGRSSNENLNAPGMHFEPLAFAESCNNPDAKQPLDCEQNRFYAYGVIARLALLAAAREMAEL